MSMSERLDPFQPPDSSSGGEPGKLLGRVVGGSLKDGVDVKLDYNSSVEDIQVGKYVVLEGSRLKFFGMVTDVRLDALNPEMASITPNVEDPFIAEVVSGTATYGTIHVLPSLALPLESIRGVTSPEPVKTVPAHFAVAREATQEDVASVFGEETDKNFWVGSPLDLEAKVCINLEELVKRSNGIFGKSGTGKTFLTRILLAGIIQKDAAVALVFDMHNEHGWQGTSEGQNSRSVKGLKQVLGSKVALFTLDEESSRKRRVSTDYTVKIGYNEITPEDIRLLRESLSITERGMDAVEELAGCYGDSNWLAKTLELAAAELQKEVKEKTQVDIHIGTIRALKTSLSRLKRFDFMEEKAQGQPVQRILEYLGRGTSVVLEFGRYADDSAAQILVANILSRRIHERYVEWTEKALGEGGAPPHPLVIVIEEAHKFLNSEVASQTIFGTIAREMRKYNVTLLVVDQRPSGISDEVMSQVGTRLCCLLDNDKDVESVLTGVAGRSELREVLAHLDSKQQALIFGHAVPMPVVIKVREYGTTESYAQLGVSSTSAAPADYAGMQKEMYGD
ncbi:MAG: ATP-binding protein [Dehalococcoidia bacterium]|nr:ATP-binding protein [Dehalococcoidia bacterium]